MYFYRIGYHSYEECPHVTLLHEKEFTKEHIENFIIEALKILIPTSTFDYEFEENYSEFLFTGDPNKKSIIDILCERFGFHRIKYTSESSYFGWDSVFNQTWDESKDMNRIREAIKDLKPQKKTKI